MYTARKTALGKLRQYERELNQMYGEALLRKHYDRAKSLGERRHQVRRAILTHEEWHVEPEVLAPIPFPGQRAIEEDLARAA